jgi:cell division topological specificity factor
MLDFLTRFFRREESSGTQAKERLRLVLLSDRVSLAPETFDAMKMEMLSVVQRYLDIDEHGLDVHFENAERRFMLLANIPVVNVKSSEQIEAERRELAVGGNGARHTTGSTVRRRRRRRQRSKGQAGLNGHLEADSRASENVVGNGHVPDAPPTIAPPE